MVRSRASKYMFDVLHKPKKQKIISIHTTKTFPYSHKKIKEMIQTLVNFTDYPGWDFGVMFKTRKEIRQQNKMYRKINEETDMLTFPYCRIKEPGKITSKWDMLDRVLGDASINLPYVEQYCKETGVDIADHLPLLIAHAILHVLGYDHETDADYELMNREENKLMKKWYESLNNPWDPYKVPKIRKVIKKEFDFMKLLELPTTK
jgi:probable rRNA maturation factor